MILVNAIGVVLFTAFIFLPKACELLNVSISDTNETGTLIRFLYNIRYKIIKFLHLGRPQYSGVVDDIYVYPFKSVSYLRVKEWEIDQHGLKFDRQFMAAYPDPKTGMYQAYTMRNIARFSLVTMSCNLEENWFEFRYPILDGEGKNEAGKYGSFRLPCEVSQEFIDANLTEPDAKLTNLWDIHFDAFSIGKALPQDFKDSMKMDRPGTTLLYTSKGKLCKTRSPSELKELRRTNFQDYFPLMFMTRGEISLVNKRLREAGYERQVDEKNFRPNLMMDVAHSIDNAYKFRIRDPKTNESHWWTISQKCPRCSIPNVDLKSGTFDKQNAVSKTLATYRKIDAADPKNHFLGQYAIHLDSGYKVKVGDRFEVMEEKVLTYLGLL